MKKILVSIITLILGVSLCSIPVTALADWRYADTADLLAPPTELSSFNDYVKLAKYVNDYYAFFGQGWHQNHGEFANPSCTDDEHESDCIHQRIWNLIIKNSENYPLEALNSMLTSGDWARRGIDRLMDILPQAQYWTLENYIIHEEVDNGWTELWLQNYQTGESLYCVMNAYTSKSVADDDGSRQFVFTWSHQDGEINNYDASQLITSLAQSKDVATAEFVSLLINRSGIIPGTTSD